MRALRPYRAAGPIGGVEILGDRRVTFDADDPENSYSRLADILVAAATHDFRSHWIRVRKKK